ncbi:MAG: hypothetical protein ACR652_17610 [Methylocystis sp.]|uniref:hypothetical protein n=1 Tax=Methylocystis sp. TaxID=1911079 RepID=UPI003DA285FB
MSSLVRRIHLRLMEKRGVEPDRRRPRYRDGRIVGFCTPLPSGKRAPEIVRRKFGEQPVSRGSRRGKRNAAYIARRKALAS